MWTQSLRKNTTAVSCFIYMYGRNQLIKIRHTWLILVTEDPMVYGLDLEILTWLDVPWNIPSPTNFRSCPMFAKYHQSVGIGTKYLADVSHSGFLSTRALSWTTRLVIICPVEDFVADEFQVLSTSSHGIAKKLASLMSLTLAPQCRGLI